MSDGYNFFCAKYRFRAAEGPAAILDVLDYSIEVLEVLPDKAVDPWVIQNSFFQTVLKGVSGFRSSNGDVIYIWNGDVWDFGL